MKNTIAAILVALAATAGIVSAASTAPPPCDETTNTCTAPSADPNVSERCHSTVNRYLIESGDHAGERCRIRTCTSTSWDGQHWVSVTKDTFVDCVKARLTLD